VHQRSKTKAIFPSLLDMFVGGVSLPSEPPSSTCTRELSEELGLSPDPDCVSPLFTTTVATGSNRCIVTVFQASLPPGTLPARLQEEEVEIGAPVPRRLVALAAGECARSLGLLPAADDPGGRRQPDAWENGRWEPVDVAAEFGKRGFDVSGGVRFVPDGLMVWLAHRRFDEGSPPPAAPASYLPPPAPPPDAPPPPPPLSARAQLDELFEKLQGTPAPPLPLFRNLRALDDALGVSTEGSVLERIGKLREAIGEP
jgi:8-oxo-dGTP pyrophosphatase MutT (NUDIX family)